MNILIMVAADLAAIFLLTFGLYLRRHRRRDLAVSYLGINIGVFAVAASLSGSAASAGLGLGLFGVLSIIRLRSTELEQHEVAYYFSALALGLISGIGSSPLWLAPSLMALILAVMFAGDHPRVLPAYRHQTVILDRAIAGEEELQARLGEVLGGKIHAATVTELDLVNDRTFVNVKFSVPSDASRAGRSLPAPAGEYGVARFPGSAPAADDDGAGRDFDPAFPARIS